MIRRVDSSKRFDRSAIFSLFGMEEVVALSPYNANQVYPIEADTLLLTEAALAEVRPGDRVLEVGTGSGYVAATLTSRGAIFVTAIEINPHAAAMARACGLDVIRTDLTAGICGTFDLILFNPPYLPTAPEERIDDWLELALDGGENGRRVIERFAAVVLDRLAPAGRLLLLVSSLTGVEEVLSLFERKVCRAEVVRKLALEGETLFVLRVARA